jgi:Enolase C-terminal domain-like
MRAPGLGGQCGIRAVRHAGPSNAVTHNECRDTLADPAPAGAVPGAALLDAGAVDCLQADVTRCGRITGLLQVGGLAEARQTGLSGHCAPAVNAHA